MADVTLKHWTAYYEVSYSLSENFMHKDDSTFILSCKVIAMQVTAFS